MAVISITDIEAEYPGADAEWLLGDYLTYCRWFEEDDDGTSEERMKNFHAWLDDQSTEYLSAHDVP